MKRQGPGGDRKEEERRREGGKRLGLKESLRERLPFSSPLPRYTALPLSHFSHDYAFSSHFVAVVYVAAFSYECARNSLRRAVCRTLLVHGRLRCKRKRDYSFPLASRSFISPLLLLRMLHLRLAANISTISNITLRPND